MKKGSKITMMMIAPVMFLSFAPPNDK